MADISVEHKKGGDLTWIWAAAAIVAVVALMAWLYSTRDTAGTSAAVVPADTAGAVAETGPAGIELSAIGGTPDQFVGQEVRVDAVPIAAVLGDRGFWADIPGQNPFLVIVGPGVSDVSWVAAGDTVGVQGTVQPVSEEVVGQWVSGQVIREGAAPEASFATHYLEVSQATP